MRPPGILDRLEVFQRAAIETLPAGLTTQPVALGWATVELDRAVFDLGKALDIPPDEFVAAPESVLLGAFCRVAAAALPGGGALVVLEPSAEGRLTASLAWLDEGPVAAWFQWNDASPREAPRRAPRTGPFGPERLLPGGPAHGPHRLILEAPGTIRP